VPGGQRGPPSGMRMRIVSLVPSVTETLFALGLDDQIVAITTFCRFPEDKVISKTKIGGTKNPEREKILELKPDVIILNEEENRKDDADFFRDQGIPIRVTFPSNVAEASEMIRQLGTEFHATTKAESISNQIEDAVQNIDVPRAVSSLIFIWKRPYWTVSKSTYVNSICETVGIKNVCAQLKDRYPQLTDEYIIAADPEAVLFPDEPYVFRQKDVLEFQNQFPGLKAVQENRLIMLDGTYLTWHGVRTLKALHELPKILKQAGLWN
jgi:iron complex transport system substrate-binding protein